MAAVPCLVKAAQFLPHLHRSLNANHPFRSKCLQSSFSERLRDGYGTGGSGLYNMGQGCMSLVWSKTTSPLKASPQPIDGYWSQRQR